MMHARIRWAIALLPSLGLVCGCSSSPTLTHTEPEPAPPSFSPAQPIPPTSGVGAPLFGGQNLRAEHTAPVAGGTLAVTRDDSTIVVADPDRDAVFLVDSASRVVRTVSLSRGDEPGRIAEGSNGALFVALRGAGAVVEIDVHGATVLRRSAVCASPRGVAYEAKTESLHVACRSGQLLSLDTQTLRPKRTLQLDPDLRDVIVRDRDLLVTRFLNAEVLLIAEDGSVSRRASPPSECGDASVLYRALSLPGGQVALAHQVSSNDIVGEGPGGYGSGSSCVVGLVSRWLTVVDPETPSGSEPDASLQGLDPEGLVVHSPMTFHSTFLPGAGPLDVAFDARGTRVASIAFDEQLPALTLSRPIIALAPRATNPVATLWVSSWDASAGQFGDPSDFTSVVLPGQPVAVAFSAAGQYIVQSREPATLQFEDGTSVRLSDESHEDSGHRMFHMDSGIGIACASCHPEGGDDGHVWHFPEGLRRTLPLQGGVLERAPFHWDGTLADMNALVSTVMVERMGLPQVASDTQIATLGAFLEQLPKLPPAEGLDSAAVARGETLFRRADVACASCHSGPQYTDNQLVDVGTGGRFVTPTLLGVGLRPALFHDGCAKSINQRFGPCGGTAHGKPELLSADERADLIAFLRSL